MYLVSLPAWRLLPSFSKMSMIRKSKRKHKDQVIVGGTMCSLQIILGAQRTVVNRTLMAQTLHGDLQLAAPGRRRCILESCQGSV